MRRAQDLRREPRFKRPCLDVLGDHPLRNSSPALAAAVAEALTAYVVPSTADSYGKIAARYVDFCGAHGVPAFPCDAVTVCAWLLRLMTSVKPTSLRVYLAAIRFGHINRGHPWTLTGNELIRRVLRYVKRRFPCGGKAAKIPISLSLLHRILPQLPGWPDVDALLYDDLLFATASVCATCGFLRGGEFTHTPHQHRPILRLAHINVSTVRGQTALVISIPQPKNDWWKVAVNVPIFAPMPLASPFNPIRLWTALCSRSKHVHPSSGRAPAPTLPAFHHADGAPLRRRFMVGRTLALLRQCNVELVDARGNPTTVISSSWRAGGVRSMVDAGASDEMIMEMGRWRSRAWVNYLLYSSLDLSRASARMWEAAVPSSSRMDPLRVGAEESAASMQRAHDDARATQLAQARVLGGHVRSVSRGSRFARFTSRS